MACTKHFWFLHWTHHSWRRSVSWAENQTAPETSMWGRPIERQYVMCQKQSFCERCGKTKRSVYCGCDKERAEHCAIYQTWLAGHQQPDAPAS